MKQRELRIGNYVNVDSGRGYEPVSVDLKLLKDLQHADCNFQGITLSAQWLELFGFQHADERIEVHLYKDIFHWYSSPGAVSLELDNGIHSYDYHTDAVYVHQLQNLYYDLTGEELTVAF